MRLHHGSYMEVPKLDIVHSRLNVDFGKGCSQDVIEMYLHFERSQVL